MLAELKTTAAQNIRAMSRARPLVVARLKTCRFDEFSGRRDARFDRGGSDPGPAHFKDNLSDDDAAAAQRITLFVTTTPRRCRGRPATSRFGSPRSSSSESFLRSTTL